MSFLRLCLFAAAALSFATHAKAQPASPAPGAPLACSLLECKGPLAKASACDAPAAHVLAAVADQGACSVAPLRAATHMPPGARAACVRPCKHAHGYTASGVSPPSSV